MYIITIESRHKIGDYRAKDIDQALDLVNQIKGKYEDIDYIHIDKKED